MHFFIDPELLNRGKLDPKTMEHLSKVFLKSTGDNPILERKNTKLPQVRKGWDGYEYGYEEPTNIPQGKASMRQILEILNSYQSKPSENSPEKLAKEYNLEVEDVKNMLKYFTPFQVFLPKKEPKKKEKLGLKLLQQKIDELKL
jgi:hypothetical protein